jgi:hypothetical protein
MSNKRAFRRIACTLVGALMFASYGAHSRAGEPATEGKSTLRWEAVEGAIRYEVTVRDEKGAVVLRETVTATQLGFSLDPGRYSVNITAINKFNKPHSESGWEEFEIAQKPPFRQITEGTLIRVAAGAHFSMPMSPWDDFLNPALGASLRVGLTGTSGLRRDGGIEADRLQSRPHVVVEEASGKETVARSGRPWWGAGLGLEYSLPFGFFLEGGLEYRNILLSQKSLASVDAFLAGGMLFNWEAAETRKGAVTQTSSAVLPVAVRVSAGVPYVQLLTDLGYVRRETHKGIDASLALQGMRGLMRFTGISFDFAYAEFKGDGRAEGMTSYLNGASLLLTTDFAFPVNLLLKAGGGIAASKLEYEDPFTLQTESVWTEDIYCTAGGGLEVRVYAGLFVEALAGYYYIDHGGRAIEAAKVSLRAGVRL